VKGRPTSLIFSTFSVVDVDANLPIEEQIIASAKHELEMTDFEVVVEVTFAAVKGVASCHHARVSCNCCNIDINQQEDILPTNKLNFHKPHLKWMAIEDFLNPC